MEVEFLNRIAVGAEPRLALEFRAHAQRLMQHRVRQIEKKRAMAVLLDECDGLVGIGLREFGGIDGALDNLAVAE